MLLLILWKVISIWVGKEIIIPSPESTFKEMIVIIKSDKFLPSIINTLTRTVIGFSFAFILSIVLGMIAGFFKPIYYLLRPVILLNKAIPTMSIILIALIWLKSEIAPILVGFLVIFPILYSNVVHGIRNIDKKLLEMARLYKIRKLKIVKDIYLPSIKSHLITGSSLAMGLNLKVIIAAEVLSQPKVSIGTSFYIEKANLNTSGVFAWSIIAVVIAAILDGIIRVIKNSTIK
ncbi:sulfonate/nitrate ABC transporter, permease protein [Gottschalkia acidurici 9a]|uniref:Sulfonate/nitrate ABC transporter, permease protein n=2 Tax=Clostridium acidurici TaxID=1556 RepID=K0AUD0_GOTA9|nr:sulfonate/nitrate ABC transporter, permease protein [Gottschalkia acidurici 9a]